MASMFACMARGVTADIFSRPERNTRQGTVNLHYNCDTSSASEKRLRLNTPQYVPRARVD